MHEPLIALAALPAPVRVAGLDLNPYSLGHELFLWREHSPFIFGGTVREGDIYEAVLICSSHFEELKHARESFFYIPILWLIKRRVEKWIKKHGKELAEQSFREYRESGCLELPISDNIRPGRQKSDSRDPGSPFILRLQQFLMLNFRMGEAQAWDYPVGLAKMRWAVFWEQEGGLEVKNWFDAECDRLAAEADASTKEDECQA